MVREEEHQVTGGMGMNRVLVVLVAALIALFVVPTVAAQNGTSQAGYGGEPVVQVTLGENLADPAAQQASAGQSLPLTGVDLGLLVAGGLVLVLVGFGMRRLTRQQQQP